MDSEKAYDRVPWGTLWAVLQGYGVLEPLLQAIQSLYNCSESCVHILDSKSDLFSVGVGLRCLLSPILFVIFLDRISRRSQGRRVLFADDG